MEDAAGRISAELLCPYPPGVPVVCPGEVVTQAVIDVCRRVQSSGGKVTGASDQSLQRLQRHLQNSLMLVRRFSSKAATSFDDITLRACSCHVAVYFR